MWRRRRAPSTIHRRSRDLRALAADRSGCAGTGVTQRGIDRIRAARRNAAQIICVGLNYRAHLAETKLKAPPYPDLFNKYNTALNRHNGTIRVSGLPLTHFDYESELVMYVGKTARNVAEADALGYVFGYSCGHDFTARDAQLRVSQWMTGKTPDEFAPLGPWLVTADQIPTPKRSKFKRLSTLRSKPRQNMNTSEMIFGCAKIVKLHLAVHNAAAGRRHLHGYAERCDPRLSAGKADLAQTR